MSEKRYFWLKLMDDFFTSKRIKRLRSMAGGDTYTIIYLKMQLKALKTDGYLYFDGVMDSFPEELALDLDESPDDVRVTVNYLSSVGLLETSDNESFKLTFMQNLVGSETASAQRGREYRANLTEEQKEKERERAKIGMRKSRKKKKSDNECYERVTNVEIEIEKEIDKDINTIEQNFEELWKLYPKKKGKGQIKPKTKREIYKVGFEKMKLAIERYKKERQGKDDQYTMYGSTFFNSGYKDYLEEQDDNNNDFKLMI